MKILKFGGTSVANANNIKLVLSIIEKKAAQSTKMAVVVSAFSGVTDLLILAATKAASKDLSFNDLVTQIKQTKEDFRTDAIKVLGDEKYFAPDLSPLFIAPFKPRSPYAISQRIP